MKDKLNVSRRGVITATVAAGFWGGVPGHTWAEPPQGPMAPNATPPATWNPTEGCNKPMGVGRGVQPGRVAWVHNPKVATWDGVTSQRPLSVVKATGEWWDDANCNPEICTNMMSKAVLGLTGEKSEAKSWEMVFKNFNDTHGFGNKGYQKGEKIAIKINMNNDRSNTKPWPSGRGMPSPQLVQAFLRQLVQNAGVPAEDITLFDATDGRFISDPIYNRIMADADERMHKIKFQVNPANAARGREAVEPDEAHPIKFSDPKVGTAYQPKCVVESKYRISYAMLRAHTICGVTLCTKNNNGSLYWPASNYWGPRVYHEYIRKTRGVPAYNAFVDILAHPQVGGKNLLNFLDGIYSAEQSETNVVRWQSFDDHWTSSIFMSQDPVAIDSVGLDFIRNEPREAGVHGTGEPDNFMHEAALIGAAPSGIKYDPAQDGHIATASLGVHEHWNNPAEKKYSRNLGKKEGIELVCL
ncbi:MAG: DUF362 domain-containing protein [Candidatus Solibacter sp.]